ncbi:MAG: hypothetical protein CML50_14005 [Rhodobacteraceae bacterium]|jgi:ribonuclease E|uniref:CPN protein n=1 Tax=Salipiger profundus TaxID=1229727 RepID=A0A1U7D6E6_9RHOB|nr:MULTISPECIES: hypothetical protein [Salipiger]APX23734.1 CPN protein [Salipiger profundus]MAB07107.1 hypothetical protein [Paracoccaceae bacterium]GGA17580.1 hypothetical protein GCM10011326_32680 [Salipiger profundus]SFD30440.1 hypothetical protein SAMN05444415_109135 [Salipiger profundus]
MVSSSKILTVSYGTFSCTAEGFEDPLGVVKDTTHFFRGIVHEDRFFGAEPPQFDPELAAQLLQAQLASEPGEGALTLQNPYRGGGASPGALSAALSAGPVTVRKAPQAEQAPVEEAEIAAERGDEPASVEPEAKPTATPHQETIAGAPEASAPVETPTPQPSEEPRGAADAAPESIDADLIEPEEESRGLADSIAAALAESDVVPSEGAPGADSLEAEAEYFEDIEEVETPPARPRPAAASTDPESVAAKLRRIREVVSAGKPAARRLSLEDENGDATARQEDLAVDKLPEAEFDEEPDDASAAPAASAAQRRSPAEAPLPPVRRARARVVKVKRAQFDTAVAKGALEEVQEAAEPARQDTVSSLSREDEDDLVRELAAVKAELEADFGNAWNDEDTQDVRPSAGVDDVDEAVSSVVAEDEGGDWDFGDEWGEEDDAFGAPERSEDEVDDERALLDDDAWGDEDEDTSEPVVRFLDETEGEGDQLSEEAAEEIQRAAAESARKAVKMSSPARAMLTEKSVRDNDASRILDETNTQLEEPEGNRRRSAIAHLRAAVAATRADKLLGRKADSEEVIEPYREDLANAVRPRRPRAPESHTERPVEPGRQAPLKLVAEQRVDASMAPARPRRVRLSDFEDEIGSGEEVGDFAEYAQSVGASDLPELLEAAAAYMSFVEGREQFSRPQLMTKVRQAEASESSREDRLRSFGQLLREGKIEKTRGGRFTASERISFKPDARAAG